MPEESTTPDLVELVRSIWVALHRQDWDAVGSFFALDAAWDLAAVGLGTFTGQAALRNFWKDWTSSYEEIVSEVDPVLDLGGGVVFAVVRQKGRTTGSTGSVKAQGGWSTSGWAVPSHGSRSTLTSTRPVLPPNASPRNGGRRCRRRVHHAVGVTVDG